MNYRKLVLGLLVLAITVSAYAAGGSPAPRAETETRKLIVYFSLTGNTRFVMEHIQTLTGADVFEIVPVNPYSQEFRVTLDRVRRERESGYLPQLASRVGNLADYDVIFIGSPNWFGTLSRPVLSFIKSHDLSGKTIVPFITHGTGGFQNTIRDLRALLPNSTILEEFGVFDRNLANSLPAITQWLGRIGMLRQN